MLRSVHDMEPSAACVGVPEVNERIVEVPALLQQEKAVEAPLSTAREGGAILHLAGGQACALAPSILIERQGHRS